MTKEEINSYTMRISQANASGLAVILYELTLRHLTDACESYGAGGYTEDFAKELSMAQDSLQELMHITKVENAVGLDVRSIHLYVSKQILLSLAKCKPVELDGCIKNLEKLKIGFEDIASRDYDPPLMENTQHVYAGLTYGKGYLNESMDPMQEQSRGLKA